MPKYTTTPEWYNKNGDLVNPDEKFATVEENLKRVATYIDVDTSASSTAPHTYVGTGTRVGAYNTSVGNNTETSSGCVSIGERSKANGGNSTAVGYQANAKMMNSIAIGFGAETTKVNQVQIGQNAVSDIDGYIGSKKLLTYEELIEIMQEAYQVSHEDLANAIADVISRKRNM